jgi:hypothetical protein
LRPRIFTINSDINGSGSESIANFLLGVAEESGCGAGNDCRYRYNYA